MLNHPVLVLNQSYEPLTVCRARRAVVLIFQGKAEMIENGLGYIHTLTQTVELPSVIRLQQLIRRPRRQRKMTRYEIFNRDKYTCQYCGEQSRHLPLFNIPYHYLSHRDEWRKYLYQ
jgi:5-methylcytosine-specific restriction endonuclease McrA